MATLGVSLHYSPSRSKKSTSGTVNASTSPTTKQPSVIHMSWKDSTTSSSLLNLGSPSAPFDPLKRLRQQDGKVLLLTGQLNKRKTLIEQQNATIQTLTTELQLKDQTIVELKGQLANYQVSFKQADGRISLLKYQLEKAKQTRQVTVESSRTTEQFIQHCVVHMAKYQSVTKQLKKRAVEAQLRLEQSTHQSILFDTTVQSLIKGMPSTTADEQNRLSISRESHKDQQNAIFDVDSDLPLAVLHRVLVEGGDVDESVLSELSQHLEDHSLSTQKSTGNSRVLDTSINSEGSRRSKHIVREEAEEEKKQSTPSASLDFDFISPIASRVRPVDTKEDEGHGDGEGDISMLSPNGLRNLFLAFAREQEVTNNNTTLPLSGQIHANTAPTPVVYSVTSATGSGSGGKSSGYLPSHMVSSPTFSSPMTDRSRSRRHGDSTTMLVANSSFASDDLENEDLDLSSYSLNVTTDMLTETRTPAHSQSQSQPQSKNSIHSNGSVPSSSERKRRAYMDYLASSAGSVFAQKGVNGSGGSGGKKTPLYDDNEYQLPLKPKMLSFEPSVPTSSAFQADTASSVHTSKVFSKVMSSMNATERANVHIPATHVHYHAGSQAALSKSTSFLNNHRTGPFDAPIFEASRSTSSLLPTASSINPLMSPHSFTDHLARIREENNKLRCDISKFKNKMEMYKQDCAIVRSHQHNPLPVGGDATGRRQLM